MTRSTCHYVSLSASARMQIRHVGSRDGQNLYATDDGGRRWYSSFAFSYIVSVTYSPSAHAASASGTIQVAVSKTGQAPAKYVFTSSDGGRKWVRHAA